MVDGFVYLRGHPVLMMSFVVDLIAMVFGMPRALFPELADVAFGGRRREDWRRAAVRGDPAGAVVGGVLSGRVSRVERQGWPWWSHRGVGLAMVGFGVAALLAPHAPWRGSSRS